MFSPVASRRPAESFRLACQRFIYTENVLPRAKP
jgi:hypothetical protein